MNRVKKMLSLIMAQVSTRKANFEGHSHKQCTHVPTLGYLAMNAIKNELLHTQPTPSQKLTLGNLCSVDDRNTILNFVKLITSYHRQ